MEGRKMKESDSEIVIVRVKESAYVTLDNRLPLPEWKVCQTIA